MYVQDVSNLVYTCLTTAAQQVQNVQPNKQAKILDIGAGSGLLGIEVRLRVTETMTTCTSSPNIQSRFYVQYVQNLNFVLRVDIAHKQTEHDCIRQKRE